MPEARTLLDIDMEVLVVDVDASPLGWIRHDACAGDGGEAMRSTIR